MHIWAAAGGGGTMHVHMFPSLNIAHSTDFDEIWYRGPHYNFTLVSVRTSIKTKSNSDFKVTASAPVTRYALIWCSRVAVSDHHHSTALYSHHHQAAMLQGAMGGPTGEGRASGTSSYTAIGASAYPPAGPILSSQVSEGHRPPSAKQTSFLSCVLTKLHETSDVLQT
jgi:hypothetical protein